MTPGVDGQSQVGKSGAQIGPPDQVVAWADVRSLTANSLSNYAASCERNVSDLTAKVTDFVEQMDGISRKAVRPTGSWCVASQGAGLRFRQPTCWSARRILKTGPTRGPSHVSDTRYNPQNVSRDQLKSVGAPRRPDRPFRAAPAQRLRPDLEADVGDVAGTAAPAAVPGQRGTGRAAAVRRPRRAAGRMRGCAGRVGETRTLRDAVTNRGCLHHRHGQAIHRDHLGAVRPGDTRRDAVRDGPRARPRTVRPRGVPHDDDASAAVGPVIRPSCRLAAGRCAQSWLRCWNGSANRSCPAIALGCCARRIWTPRSGWR